MESETEGMIDVRQRWEAQPESLDLVRLILPHRDQGVPLYFQRIEPGHFMMGSRFGGAEEEPEHRVEIGEPFYLGTFPVTQEQFACWTGSAAYGAWYEKALAAGWLPSYAKGRHENENKGNPKHPAENLNWYDAVGYCDWLNAHGEALGIPEGWVARLPPESHWEYACRAGSRTEYSSGDGEAALREVGWFYGEGSEHATKAVGGKRGNGWGLYDLHGNVWEWCLDEWSEDAYRERIDRGNGLKEGRSLSGADAALRVLRGGSWYRSARDCRSAYRRRNHPTYRIRIFGFRVALLPGPVKGKGPVEDEARKDGAPEVAESARAENSTGRAEGLDLDRENF